MNNEKATAAAVHVCLISEQPIPNLVPLLLEKPAKAVFLVSPQMRPQAERLVKVVQPHGIKTQIEEISSAYDFTEVEQACRKVIEAAVNPDDLTLNVTGGTKIAALAAYQAFYFNNRRIIYLDTANNKLLQLAPTHAEIALAGMVKLRDYLRAYGMTPLPLNDDASKGQRPGLAELAQLLIKDDQLLSSLNAAIHRHGKNPSYINISLNELREGADKLAGLLCQCGVAMATQSGSLNISSREKIIFCNGGWLEEYVYWAVKSLGIKGLDLAMNITVQWDGKGKQQTENEFDVLFTYANRLHLISCKAANPEKTTAAGTRATEALNELDALSDRAGGLFGKPLLLSARKLSPYDRERAKKMNITLIDGLEVLNLKDSIRPWLGL